MLTLELETREMFDEKTNTFVEIPGQRLVLEHSLISLSKWEERWHEPYLGRQGERTEHTPEQVLDYIRCMLVTKNVPDRVLESLTPSEVEKIVNYINDPHTATTFYEDSTVAGAPPRKRTVTAELIYYWMLKAQIPFEAQKWHLNKLLTLIRVCETMDRQASKSGSKRSPKSIAASRRMLNAQRKSMLGTSG